MLRIRAIMTVVLVAAGLFASAQTENPFELKYRSKAPSKSAVKPAPESLTIAPAPEIAEPEPVVIDTPVAPPITGEQPLDTMATLTNEDADTASTGINVEEPIEEDVGEDDVESETVSVPIQPPSPPVPSIGVVMILVMMGITLLVLTWAVNMNRGFIRKIFRAAMNENLSALLLREQKFASLQYLYYIVYAVFFINAALFIFLMSRYAVWDFGHRSSPLIAILGILTGVYLFRHLFMKILGQTFTISKETTHFSFNIVLYNILAGIGLMPVNLFLAFGPPSMRMPVIYFGLGLLVILYLLRQLRGLNIAGHLISSNVFQFFVYLCAVEILPVLVLFKYFITN